MYNPPAKTVLQNLQKTKDHKCSATKTIWLVIKLDKTIWPVNLVLVRKDLSYGALKFLMRFSLQKR